MYKIFQVIPSLEIGGAEKFVIDLSANLDKLKYKVFIISLYDSNYNEFDKRELLNDNIEIITLHKKRGFDYKTLIAFNQLLKIYKPDIVHTHTYAAAYTIFLCWANRTKAKVHTVHSIAIKELNKTKRGLMKFAYHYLSIKPVGISNTVTKSIQDEYGISNVKTIYNGIDLNKYHVICEMRKNNTLINVARLSDVKNQELLIRAFSIALTNNKDIKLNIVGDGPNKESLEKLINELQLKKHVKLLGKSSEVNLELNKSDCFILTSKFEGLPLSILEAMACGLPIISTNVGGVKDIVKHNENGYLVAEEEREIARYINLLFSNKKNIKRMSNNSLAESKKYDVKVMAKEYEEFYESIIEKRE